MTMLIHCPFCHEKKALLYDFYGVSGHRHISNFKDGQGNYWMFMTCDGAAPNRGWYCEATGQVRADLQWPTKQKGRQSSGMGKGIGAPAGNGDGRAGNGGVSLV